MFCQGYFHAFMQSCRLIGLSSSMLPRLFNVSRSSVSRLTKPPSTRPSREAHRRHVRILILPPQLHDTVIKMFQWWSQDTTCNRALNCRVTDDLEYEERSVWSNFSLLSTSSQTVNWGTCFFYFGVRHIKMSIKQLKKHPDSVYLSDIDVTFRVWAQ